MIQTCQIQSKFIKAEKLCWSVPEKLILDNIDFSVSCGEFVGVIGPNGAGKSSLLRLLYQKNIPDSGKIEFNGKLLTDYSRISLAQQIAVVLQESPTQFELTVMDVIRMGLIPNKSLLSFDTTQDLQAIKEATRKVDLSNKLTQPFNSLSGGEKQRAMIARAILQSPQLLLMDEPTNHLDIRHQIEVLELARGMGITVIVSIHDLNLAAAYCDRLILLDQGKIVAQGAPESVLTQEILKNVFHVDSLIDQHPFTKKIRVTFGLDREKSKEKTESQN